jgi:hypothetical protein
MKEGDHMKKLLALMIVSLFIVFSSGAAMAIEAVGPEGPGDVETTDDEESNDDGDTGETEAEGGENRCRGQNPQTPVERLKYRFLCGESQ